jgi:hypothetical protein
MEREKVVAYLCVAVLGSAIQNLRDQLTSIAEQDSAINVEGITDELCQEVKNITLRALKYNRHLTAKDTLETRIDIEINYTEKIY